MIIGLLGFSKTGKDLIAKMIHDYSYGWENKKFSGKLKTVASIITGIPERYFEDQEFKQSFLGPEWNHMSIREFLQVLGTEGLRDNLNKDVWVNALFADYDDSKRWVISDVRFPNEFSAIKERGGVTVRIHRRGIKPVNEHSSETALDSYKTDYVIYNNGSELELLLNVKETLGHLL